MFHYVGYILIFLFIAVLCRHSVLWNIYVKLHNSCTHREHKVIWLLSKKIFQSIVRASNVLKCVFSLYFSIYRRSFADVLCINTIWNCRSYTYFVTLDGNMEMHRCRARGGIASNEIYVCLSIAGLPYVRPMSTVSAVAGKQFHIKCPVAGYPIESIVWEKGEVLIRLSILPTCARDIFCRKIASRLNRREILKRVGLNSFGISIDRDGPGKIVDRSRCCEQTE